MRIANLSGRVVLVVGDDEPKAVDIANASHGFFGPEPQGIFERWDEFRTWSRDADISGVTTFSVEDLQAPAPTPRQLFAIGLNYVDHAAESGLVPPTEPTVFTKWASSLSGPVGEVLLPQDGTTDWEVELVAVLSRGGSNIDEADAWDHVAGLAVGQDLSERTMQLAGPAPQWSLGKSLPGFGPMGPWLITPDELDNRDDLEITCSIDGEQVQVGRTSDMIFPIPVLIAKLSAALTLYPGDVIYTGTPPGVGVARTPQRFLQRGEELVSRVSGIGELRQRFV